MLEHTVCVTEDLQIDSQGQHPFKEDEIMLIDVQKIVISKKTNRKTVLA